MTGGRADGSTAADTPGKTAPATGAAAARTYVDRVLDSANWVLTALGAVASAAIAKLGFDRLGDGEYDLWLGVSVFVSAVGFALGVVWLIGSALSATTTTRVPFNWLLNAEKPAGKRGFGWKVRRLLGSNPDLAWEVRSALGRSRYLLPGAFTPEEIGRSLPSGDDPLDRFERELSRLMAEQAGNPPAFLGCPVKVKKLKLMLDARRNLHEAAARVRFQALAETLPRRFAVAAALVALGATGFGFTTAQAQRRAAETDRERTENAEKVVTGTLLPKTPAEVRVLPPPASRPALSSPSRCDDQPRDGLLVEIATPPTPKPPVNVMRVVTIRTEDCPVVELWLPPERVVPRPAQSAATSRPPTPSPTASGK